MKKGEFSLNNLLQLLFVLASLLVLISCGAQIKKVVLGDDTLAETKFAAFVTEIRDLEKSKEFRYDPDGGAVPEGTELYLEKGMAVVYFEPGKSKVNLVVDMGTRDQTIDFFKPNECGDKGCLCLFREHEVEDTGTFYDFSAIVRPVKPLCEKFDFAIKVDSCEFGTPESVDSYTCSDGFVIERGVVEKIGELGYFKLAKRPALFLEKHKDGVLIRE
jgi:hypothetical protein